MGLEQAVNAGFRYKVAFLIGESHCKLTRAQLTSFQRHLQYLFLDVIRDAVPGPAWSWPPIFQRILAELLIQIIPAVKSRSCDAQPVQRLLRWQMRAFDNADDLELF